MAHELSQTFRVDDVAHHAIAAARVTRVPRFWRRATRVEGALDHALDAVKAASGDDEREAARELCVTIIDAMGPGKESLRARKKLASVLF